MTRITSTCPLLLALTLVLACSVSSVNGWVVLHSSTHQSNQGLTPHTSLFMADNMEYDDGDEDDDYGFDEETARNPSAEIKRLKQQIEEAKEEGDMDKVMTLVGTLLALGGGYDNEN